MTIPIRLGVIGCGKISATHLDAAAASPQAAIEAIADVREDALAAAAERWSVAKTYPSGEALLDDPAVDAVVLALPTAPRFALAMKAFAAGKHVLTEKPVAMNADQVRQMIAARGDCVGACCSARYRFAPYVDELTALITGGGLGELRVVHCRATGAAGPAPQNPPPPWRVSHAQNGGGIFVNWGSYDLDYLLGLCGWTLEPQQVLARTWPVAPVLAARVAEGSDAETHCAAFVACAGGVALTYERAEFAASGTESIWRIVGSRGAVWLDMSVGDGRQVVRYATDPDAGTGSEVFWEGDFTWEDNLHGPVRDFLAAIAEKRPPRTTLEQALVVQRITDAVYRSAETGDVVAVEP